MTIPSTAARFEPNIAASPGRLPARVPYLQKVAILAHFGSYLLSRGLPPASLLERCDLPTSLFLNREAWTERRKSLKLIGELERISGDPLCAMRAGHWQQFAGLGSFGLGIRQSATLQSAIEFAIRHIQTIETGTRIKLRRRKASAVLTIEFDGSVEGNFRQYTDGRIKFLRNLLDLAAESVEAVAWLPYAKPKWSSEIEGLLGTRLEFGSRWPALSFDPAALALPLQSFSGAQIPRVHGICPRTPGEAVGAAHRLIRELIQRERPTLACVANRLQIKVRTMQRLIGAYGLTFEDLLDQYRHRSAIEHLDANVASITDIAFLLGYADSAHFTRAFRRWTGTCPRDFKRRIQ